MHQLPALAAAAALLTCTVPVLHVTAADSTYGVLTYEQVGSRIVITGCDKTAAETTIPAEIDGLPVTAIAAHAFEGASITTVTIPESVTTIGEWAFGRCSALQAVDIPGTVKVVQMDAFADCTALTELTLHEGLIEIRQGAFNGTGIRAVTLPETLREIRSGSFAYCEALTEVTFPDRQVDVYSGVFEGTPWLDAKRAEDPLVIVNGTLIDGRDCVGDVVIPDDVTIISSGAFQMNTGMTSVRVPQSVKDIWDQTFFYCSALRAVDIRGAERIAPSAFSCCEALEEVRLPACLTEIGAEAFDTPAVIPVYFGGTRADWAKVQIGDVNLLFEGCEMHYAVYGDVDWDDTLTVTDLIALAKWIHAVPGAKLENADAADLDDDGRIDGFDLALLKRELLRK